MSDKGIKAVEDYLGRLSGEEKAPEKPAAKPAEKKDAAPAPAEKPAETPPAPKEGEEVAEPVEGQEEEAPTEKYRLRNASGKALEWDSEQAAFDNISALRGMHKGLQERVKALAENSQANYTFAQQAQTRIQELERALAGQNAGQGGNGHPPAAQPGGSPVRPATSQEGSPSEIALDPNKGILEQSVDWNLYKTFRDTHGPEAAQIWATEVALRRVQDALRAELQQSLSPLSDNLERANITQEAQQLFLTVANYQAVGGGHVYPEMQDQAALGEILQVWSQTPLDPQAKLTPYGVHMAVLAWRDWRRAQGRGWSPNGSSGAGQSPSGQTPASAGQQVDPLAAAREIVESVIHAAEEGDSPVGNGSAHRSNSPRANREQRLKARLRQAKITDQELGFGR
jgi:hypothetical protein